jgi:DNA polymerase-1
MAQPNCPACPLNGSRIVPSKGPQPSDILVVGQGPGKEEVKKGEPFVGKSGKELDKLLASVGIHKGSVRISNIIQCQTPDNRKPVKEEVEACRPHMEEELRLTQPKVIVILGDVPLRFFFPKRSLTKYHGTALEEEGIKYLITYHPAAGFRDPKRKKATRQDFLTFEPHLLGKAPKAPSITSHIIDHKDLYDLLQKYNPKQIAFDTEVLQGEMVGLSCSWKALEGYYLPYDEALKGGKLLMRHPSIKIAHHLKYDMNVLRRYRIRVPIYSNSMDLLIRDTMVAAYILEYSPLGLKSLAARLLGRSMKAFNEIREGQEDIPLETLAPYSVADAEATYSLNPLLEEHLRSLGLYDIYMEIDLPLVPILADMEYRGVLVDKKLLQTQAEPILKTKEEKYRELQSYKENLNPNSVPQLKKLLFEELNLPNPKQGSTDIEVLSLIKDEHPIVPVLMEYRKNTKLYDTYYKRYLEDPHPRLHGEFSQTRTGTGRLASSDPNQQNIPKTARNIFIAPDGKVLVIGDYIQMELVMAAFLSQDKALAEAIKTDVHNATAIRLFGTGFTPEQRKLAKTVNFLVLYGGGPDALIAKVREETGLILSREEAARLIRDYFTAYPKLYETILKAREFAKTRGYAETILGRRQHIPNLWSNNPQEQEEALKEAFSHNVQGSCADVCKMAMVELYKVLPQFNAYMILQVHDELVIECPIEYSREVIEIMRFAMESVLITNPPLRVEIAIGRNWRDKIAV